MTVQEPDWPELRLAGVQFKPTGVGVGAGVVIVPPVPASVRALACNDAPSVFVRPIAVVLTPEARVAVTIAATPFCITFSFTPAKTQE